MDIAGTERDFNSDGCLSRITVSPAKDFSLALTTTFGNRSMSFEAKGSLSTDRLDLLTSDPFDAEDSEDLRRVGTVAAGLIKGMSQTRGIDQPFPQVYFTLRRT